MMFFYRVYAYCGDKSILKNLNKFQIVPSGNCKTDGTYLLQRHTTPGEKESN